MKSLNELDLNKKKYIIFDIDGTLIDSIGVWNLTDQLVLKKLTNKDYDLNFLQEQRESFLRDNNDKDIYLEYCSFLTKKYHLNISKEELLRLRWKISDEILINNMDYKKDVDKLIKELSLRGFILVIATLTSNEQLDIYFNKNKKMVNKIKADMFDFIIKKDDVLKQKPNPEIYLKILEHYNVNSDLCLVFEDSLTGIKAAKGAGMDVVCVYDKYSDNDREEINKITDYYINDYQEFINIL